jgi:hypothetical protein
MGDARALILQGLHRLEQLVALDTGIGGNEQYLPALQIRTHDRYLR